MQISNIDNSQIFCKQTRETNTKMSTNVDFEIARDKDGFLKCEDCQRRFLTKIGFENHSYNQHKKEAETKDSKSSLHLIL